MHYRPRSAAYHIEVPPSPVLPQPAARLATTKIEE